MYDVVVVGGGPAGLSAALLLGRARRRTLVVDAGSPRNAPSAAAHTVFTRDGAPPRQLLEIGRSQLTPYDSVEWKHATVTDAQPGSSGFDVTLSDGTRITTRKLILAYGVIDELPPIPGLRELWGKSVVHCPYCHGWELRDQPCAIYGRGEPVVEFVKLLLGWTRDLVVCSDGPAELSDAQRDELARHGVAVREERVDRLAANGEMLEKIVFADGSELPRRALYLRPPYRPASDLAARLGCKHTDLGLIATDEWGETSVPGVYAAGDAATPMQQVIRAAAQGASAAARLNHTLAVEDFASAALIPQPG